MEQKGSPIWRVLGVSLSLALVISVIMVGVGMFAHWNTAVQFSNGFFIAGMIVVVFGILSVTGGFQQRASFPLTYAETASQASLPERTQRMMADINQRYGMLIIMVATGLLLIAISILIPLLF